MLMPIIQQNISVNIDSYSVLSISLDCMVISMQLVNIVTITRKLNHGWTSIKMATLRIGLKGLRMNNALVALNRKISFPLLITTNVCAICLKSIHSSILMMFVDCDIGR